ncbi:MAG: nitroreductase family protein, partial [Clostridiales bacterium]|nr:nitroreductase family protein [Clostridiales bacterium]
MTNEEYLKAIDIRCSRRTFKNNGLENEAKEVIKELVEYVNKKANLNFVFIDDARFAFNIHSGKTSLIAVCAGDSIAAREACGFYGETIVLQCAYHGIATCWVGSYNENKVLEKLDLPKGIRLYCVIALGYASKSKSVKEKIMYNATHKKSKPYQKMFEVCDKKLPDEFVFAMQQVEKAPSSVNRRPVKFRYENSILSGSVDEPYSDKSIDFGIAQLHFQLGASAKGIKGKWINGSFIVDDEKIL